MTPVPAGTDRTTSEGAVRGLLNRLADSSEKIAGYERHLAAERRRRDLLLLEGTTAGQTTRALGWVAGMSSPAVTYATRRARQALAASSPVAATTDEEDA